MEGSRSLRFALLVALLVFAAGPAAAAEYPTKPVRLIVPFPPGGSNDIVARMIGNELSGKLGQQVIVDNRGGAGGIIGSEIAANSTPDGYTLLIVSVAYAYNPAIYKSRLKFNPEKSFAPVAMLGSGPNVLAVNPKLPVNSVKELVAMARAKPGAVAYATAGLGSFQHLGSEMFRLKAGIDMLHVPFKGGGPAMADVIAGNTQVAIGSLLQTIPFIRNGRLRALGVGSVKRNPALPDVPTIAEAGVPGYEASNWWGIMAPAGTPTAAINRLNSELQKILASADIQKKFETQGGEALYKGPAEFGKFIKAETVKWGTVVRDAGIKAE